MTFFGLKKGSGWHTPSKNSQEYPQGLHVSILTCYYKNTHTQKTINNLTRIN